MSAAPSLSNRFYADHIARLADSYRRWTGRELIDIQGSPLERAQHLWTAPFAVASHTAAADPIFNYGNQTALRLFEWSWEDFTRLPSRRSAETLQQGERERLLQQVAEHGYIDNYSGIRISSTGRRFIIRNATVWNIVDDDGARIGQAVRFDTWEFVE